MRMQGESSSIAWQRVVACLLAIACTLLCGCTSSRKATSTDEGFFEPLKTVNQLPAPKPPQIDGPETLPARNKKADSLIIHQKTQELRIKALAEQHQVLDSVRQVVHADSSRESNKQPTRVSKPSVPDEHVAPLTYEEAVRDYKAGTYQKALDEFQKLLGRGVHKNVEDEFYLLIGVSQYHLKRFDLAIASLKRVVDAPRAMRKADAYYVLGLALTRLGNYAQAKTMFESAIKESPGSELAAAAQKKLNALPAAK